MRRVYVFLAEPVPEYSGGERLSDLLNGNTLFIPALDEKTEAMTFVHTTSIALAWVDAAHEVRDEDQLTILTEHDVEVRMVDGQRLQGLITYVQPEDRSRLNDYLNDAPPFIRLIQGDRVALVNKRHVAYVELLPR